MSLPKSKKAKIFYSEETAHLFCPDDDLRGQKFGRLTAIQFAYKCNKIYYYKCVCECGKECVKSRGYLIYESSSIHKSCGCWRKEQQQLYRERTCEFYRRIPGYNSWMAMKGRCCNPNNSQFHDYGGRGIKVCDRWLHSFENFLADMGERPGKEYSIDRIDNNGDYCPENCRWATRGEQGNNKRNNILITYQGRTQTFRQWCRELDLPYYSAILLYKKGKRSFEEIIEYYATKK